VTDAQVVRWGDHDAISHHPLRMNGDVNTLLQVTLDHIVATVTSDIIVAFHSTVAFVISLVALITPSPVMTSLTLISVLMQLLENDWTDLHKIWYGRYTIREHSKLINLDLVHSDRYLKS
jgi:hypothetical protein